MNWKLKRWFGLIGLILAYLFILWPWIIGAIDGTVYMFLDKTLFVEWDPFKVTFCTVYPIGLASVSNILFK